MAHTIVLMRHAHPLSEGYAEDALRPLSDEGRQVQKKVVQQLKEKGLSPQWIYSSPVLRAMQTAELTSELTQAEVIPTTALGMPPNFDGILQLIREEKKGPLFLIGHMPTMAELVELLTHHTSLNHFETSGSVIITFDRDIDWGKGLFIDYLSPLRI